MRSLCATLAVAVVLAGCSDGSGGAPAAANGTVTSAAASPTGDPSAASPTPERKDRRVPDVTRLGADEASARLAAHGFRVRELATSHSTCVADRLVLGQAPPARYLRPEGSRVTLEVNERAPGRCGLDLPPADPDLAAVARAYVAFARGHGPAPATSPSVDLYLGGRLLHTVPGARSGERAAYGWLCQSGGYAARVCPFSSLATLSGYPGPVAATSLPPRAPCGGYTSIRGVTADRVVTLVADESRSCVDHFAVELAVDAAGRLAAVNLLVSEP